MGLGGARGNPKKFDLTPFFSKKKKKTGTLHSSPLIKISSSKFYVP